MNRLFAPLMLAILVFVGVVAPALAGTTIPLELTIALDPDGYIQPTCSKCQNVVLETQSGGTQALLTLTYYDELQRDFVGTIEVTVELADGTRDTVYVDDVSLTDGEPLERLLDAPGSWSWLDVEKAQLHFQAD